MFVDTNILIYATRPSSSFHERAKSALAAADASEPRKAVSRQVLREYLAVVTRPSGGSEALSMTEALADVAAFAADFEVLEDGPEVARRLVELCRTVRLAGRQVHDASIVATMLAHGEDRLLTLNRSDFQRFEPQIEEALGDLRRYRHGITSRSAGRSRAGRSRPSGR
ncbi:MAG: type II toxin-antitoxin system VapC family toxin [Geminicoccaceae bacterium]